MSSFMGNAGNGTAGIDTSLTADDYRIWPEYADSDGQMFTPMCIWSGGEQYWTAWWPGAVGMDASGGEWLIPIWFDHPEMVSGSVGRFGFIGVTRDAYGTAVGGATVKLYRTSTDEVVCVATSDPLGNFGVTTQYYPNAHYMVAYKSGVPDIEGTTTNNLIPG
jgi:hypothetical protein